MVGANAEDFPIMMDKKEAVAEINRNLKDKWNSLNYLISHVEFWRYLQMYKKGIVLEKKTGIVVLC